MQCQLWLRVPRKWSTSPLANNCRNCAECMLSLPPLNDAVMTVCLCLCSTVPGLCKNFPAKFRESHTKCSAAHPRSAQWRNISASHSPNLAGLFLHYSVQGWAKEWALGCVNPASRLPLAAGGEFTQPRARSFAQPCTNWVQSAMASTHFGQEMGVCGK